jgi:single-strand DNA-binding protein
MASLNRAQIIGNLTRDPEVRTTPTGQSVANFGVATTRVWTDDAGQKQEKTEFHNVVAWRRLAEICGQYLTKGKKVYIEGHLQTRDWETQDGQKRQRTEIIAENLIMLSPPPQGAGSTGSYGAHAAPPAAPSAPSMPVIDMSMGEQEIKVEDIPF